MFNILPLVIFGLGHALFTTVQGPTVPKLVKDKSQLGNTISLIKISESTGITIFTQLAGYIRMLSNGYNGVLFILSMCCVVSMTASYTLLEENKSVGHQKFNIKSIIEQANDLKGFILKKVNILKAKYEEYKAKQIDTPTSKTGKSTKYEHIKPEKSSSSSGDEGKA